MIQESHQSKQPNRAAWTMEHLLVKHSINLGLALNALTHQTYSSLLNSYLTFCKLHYLNIKPISQTLSLYITFMVHHIEPHSVRTYLAGIVSELKPFYPLMCEA